MSTSSCRKVFYHVHIHFTPEPLWYCGMAGRIIEFSPHALLATAVDETEVDDIWALCVRMGMPVSHACMMPCNNDLLTDDQRKLLHLAD